MSATLSHLPPKIPDRTLTVSEEILRTAEPCNARHCMVAIAIREQVDGAWSVSVDDQYIRFNVGGEADGDEAGVRYCYPTPASVGEKISNFDDEQKRLLVRPFKLKLDGKYAYISLVVKKGPRPLNKPKAKHGQGKTKRRVSLRNTMRRYHGAKACPPQR